MIRARWLPRAPTITVSTTRRYRTRASFPHVVLLDAAWPGIAGRVLFASPLRVSGALVSEEDEPVTDGLGADEAHGLLVGGLAEQALAGPEHDRVNEQPQLIDQVVLHERAPELIAGVDDDVPVQLPLQLGDLAHDVAVEYRRVAPLGLVEGRGHDVLGQAVQPVRPLVSPG